MTRPIDWSRIKQIAVIRALFLGDLLCAVPALRALRRAAPDAHIALLGLPWADEFCERFSHYVSEFVEFPGFPGLVEQPTDAKRITSFLGRMQERRFDLAIQMHGSGTHVNEFVGLLGAGRTAGYYVPGEYCPEGGLFLAYRKSEPEVRQHLRLMESLGAPHDGESLEFPIRRSDEQRLQTIEALDRESPYVCIHPGGKLATRRWPAERFAEVACDLAAEGLQVVLTGVEAERPLIEAVQSRLNCPSVNLCGQTDLGSLAALIRGSRLLVTNDTGVSHLAAAVRTPSVVIGLGSDLARWTPLDSELHRVIAEPIGCRPCEHAECPIGFPCAERVEPWMVLDQCHELLSVERPARRPIHGAVSADSICHSQEFARCDA